MKDIKKILQTIAKDKSVKSVYYEVRKLDGTIESYDSHRDTEVEE